MANKRINDLQARSDFDATCNVPVDDASQSWRATGAQIRDFIAAATAFITGRTEDTTPDPAADYIQSYDASATANKKIKLVRAHDLTVVAKTTTYVATIDDDVILCSSSAFTVTLPAVASANRKVLTIKKTDSSLTNIITVDGDSSDTIDGATSVTLNTEGECITLVCNGSAWYVKERVIPEIVNTFTPTGSWVSNVTYSGKWRRRGRFAKIRVNIACSGTPTNTPLTITLPVTIDTTQLFSTTALQEILGWGIANDSSTNYYEVLASYSGTTAVAVMNLKTAYSNFEALGINTVFAFGSGDSLIMDIEVPVSGWAA